MKAITLWEPWASAVVLGSKRIETRSWSTKYRGTVLIHAGTRRIKQNFKRLDSQSHWWAALRPICLERQTPTPMIDLFTFGAIIGQVDLVDCRPSESFTLAERGSPRWPEGESPGLLNTWHEEQLGDFSAGRFGWELQNPKRYANPIPFAGHQKLFTVPDSLAYKVSQL